MEKEPIKKYELTDDTIEVDGHTLHRIKALRNFGEIKAGELGGIIESEDNLSHEGNCWVSGKSQVYGYAQVYDNALVSGAAVVSGNAEVCNDAVVSDRAVIKDSAMISDNARVTGNARVSGDSLISGDAQLKEGHYYDEEIKNISNGTSVGGEQKRITPPHREKGKRGRGI